MPFHVGYILERPLGPQKTGHPKQWTTKNKTCENHGYPDSPENNDSQKTGYPEKSAALSLSRLHMRSHINAHSRSHINADIRSCVKAHNRVI